MPCVHPLRAYRTKDGDVKLSKDVPDSTALLLPCSNCIACRQQRAKAWALRCSLELQTHDTATFTTLTYDQRNLPPTLSRRHLQLWLKRLRKNVHQVARAHGTALPLRFFASGEYGEANNRPHYHAILFGLDPDVHGPTIQETWGLGFAKNLPVTPASINYVAGYNAKKIGWRKDAQHERVDPETGEVYTWQPPFLQMSRRPGIGHHAKQWRQSWRLFAIQNGIRQPVPRYLHQAWLDTASPEDIEQLQQEKYELTLTRHITDQQRQATETILKKQQETKAASRKL